MVTGGSDDSAILHAESPVNATESIKVIIPNPIAPPKPITYGNLDFDAMMLRDCYIILVFYLYEDKN